MPAIPHFPLKIFFDGACSVCAGEMARYRGRDSAEKLEFIDISLPSFDPLPLGIPLSAFMAELHAIDSRGVVYRGVEAFWAIWQAFPASTLLGVMGRLITHPLLNPLAHAAYRTFARLRRYFPRRSPVCTDETCKLHR